MADASATLARFSSGLALEKIPPEVRERAKTLIIDSIGVGMGAWWGEAGPSAAHVAALEALGQARESGAAGTCTTFGAARAFTPPAAAELNGALIHSLDFDDTYAKGALHPSATVLPAALAAAQLVGAGGNRVLTAVVLGYELVCRLAVALGASDHYDRGFHPTATCGAFGAAIAAAKVFQLDATQTESALGIALSQTAGSLQFLENGAWTKRFQVGNAARAGLVSAQLARVGYRGPTRPIEGRHGFLSAYAPNANEALATAGLGREWRTREIAVKPYPACRFAHAAIDAILALRREHDLKPSQVRSMECCLPQKGILLVGEPIDRKRGARTVVEGQFSMPFLAAAALLEGGVSWDTYDRCLGNPTIHELMQRTEVLQSPEMEALFPDRFGARVKILLHDGRLLERCVESPSGEPDNFPSADGIRAKFIGLVHGHYPDDQVAQLLDRLWQLEDLVDVEALFLTPA